MILLTGATGYTGRFLLRRLAAGTVPFRCIVRPSSDRGELNALGVEYHMGDLEVPDSVRPAFVGVKKVLHLAHIRYAKTIVECIDDTVEHLVMVSSLRRFSAVPSPSVEETINGEAHAASARIPCTLLRPAMIYGPGDRNISRIAAYLRRRAWIPVFGNGEYLQQPVYVEDVVNVLLAVLERPWAGGRSYAIAGAEALTYNCLIDRVGEAVGVRPRKMRIPLKTALAGLWLAKRIGVSPSIDAEQIRRLSEHKVYSIAAAQADLDYTPLTFASGLAQIYKSGVERG